MELASDPIAQYQHERNKLFWIDCRSQPISAVLSDLEYLKFPSLNVGKEIATFLQDRIKGKYLHLDTQEFVKKVFVQVAKNRDNFYPPAVAIYNLGILFEPVLKMDPSIIIKDLSKEIGILILWDSFVETNGTFHWGDRSKEYCLNFSETNIHKIDLSHEVH